MAKNYCGYIYIIKNTLNNNKVYIGQTSRTILERWGEHKRHLNDGMYIHNAMKKYGIDNFYIEILETIYAESKDLLINKLNEKEKYWISLFKSSMYDYGYNLTLGGENVSDKNCKKIDVYSIDGILLDICNSYMDASYKYKIIYQTVQNVTYGNKGYAENEDGEIFVFRRHGESFDKYDCYKFCRKIYKISLDGKILNLFIKTKYAAEDIRKELNLTTSNQVIINNINKSIREQSIAYGYIWSEDKNINIKDVRISKYGYYKICQYDMDTYELLNEFLTISEASKFITGNMDAITAIQKCCEIKSSHAYKYIWRYDNQSPKLKYNRKKKRGRKVNMYSIDNVYEKTFNSLDEARKHFNKNQSSVITEACIKGYTAYNHKWFYADDPNQPDKTKIVKEAS